MDDESVRGENGHPYPSHYLPGTHWASDASWRILDQLPVGLLPDRVRFMLGGQIAGMLSRVKHDKLPVSEDEIADFVAPVPDSWRDFVADKVRDALAQAAQ